MGNSESSNPVRNMDKRTARREYKDDFINAIQRYRKAYIQSHATKNSNIKPSFSTWDDNSIRVFARKRPIFSHEIESDEYDVITCHQDTIIIHDARMHTDMKRQFINHHEFQFDYVFNEWETNQSVYEISTKPLVEIACEGGFSTALVYGQTGSGKTFTMSSMYSQAADEIFHFLHKKVERFSNSLPIVTVAFIEIAGDNVHDLLNAFTPTQLRSAGDGSVHAFPVTEPRVTNKEELLAVVQHGLNIRTTAATGVHDASSRSHAILKIYIQRTDLRNKNGTNDVIEGTLTLVDLAGSEHRIDSMYHGKERRKETSHINASLMALKECIRAKAMGTSQSHQHVFRKSKLTMALKNSFNLPHARTIVIATVSPASKDTEHSLNTLRHACIMHGQENEEGGSTGDKETRFVTGGKITTEEIGEINIARIAKRNFEKKKSNNGALDELKTNNGNQVETKLAKAANKEIEITDKMKRKMRRLSENKSFVTLDESIQRLLKTSRERLGKEERQFARLQVASGNSGSANNNPDYETLQKIVEEERDERKVNERDSSEDEGVQDGVDQSHSKKQQQQPFARNSLDQDFAALYEDDFENFTPRSSANHGDVKPSIAHKPVGGSTGKSSSQYSRVPFEKIFECIFIAKDSVPLSILLMQLRAMLKVHHYSTEEIEHFINKEVKGKGSTTGSSTPQKNNARPTTPRRPATPQRPLSASRSGSSSSINQANDRSRSNSHTHSQPNNKTPNRRMSNGSNVSNYAHGKSTMADSDNETYSSANDNSSVSRSHRPQAGISKMSSADREREEKMLHAKQQLELEAQQRKQRQEAARQFRQEQEQHKVNQIMTKTGINPNNNNAKRQQMMLMLQKKSFEEENERRIQKEIEEHQQEIHRLNQLIEIDRTAKTTDEKLSMAQKFGVKKQLALHKAAILKAERKKASLGENLSVVSVAGGGSGGGSGAGGSSGYDDEPSPSEMRRSLSRDSVAGHQNSRPVVDFDDMVVPTHSRSAGGVNGGNAEKKSIRTDASGSGGNGNGSGNNMRFYGASGGGEGVKKRPEWNFDVPSDSAFSNDSIAEHNTADSGKDSDDLPLISERGRPLSMRMAQQMAKRNPAAPQY